MTQEIEGYKLKNKMMESLKLKYADLRICIQRGGSDLDLFEKAGS